MKRVAEIIYIVPEEREAYLEKYMDPSPEISKILWDGGIRRQHYYTFDNLFLVSYEYVGKHFMQDMKMIRSNKLTEDYFVMTRRKDVPYGEMEKTNWWAPLKWGGAALMTDPYGADDESSYAEHYRSMLSGEMEEAEEKTFAYSEDDWSESVHM